MVEGACLESKCTVTPYRGFESRSLRHNKNGPEWARFYPEGLPNGPLPHTLSSGSALVPPRRQSANPVRPGREQRQR